MFAAMRRAHVRVAIASSFGLFATTASAQPALPQGDPTPDVGEETQSTPPATADGRTSSEPPGPTDPDASTPTASSSDATLTEDTQASSSGSDDARAPEDDPQGSPAGEPGLVGGRREGLMTTSSGSIGHFYTALPDVGERFSVRFRVFTDFFVSNRFMVTSPLGSDRHARVRGGVALGFSPFKWGEVFFTVRSVSNRNERPILDPSGNPTTTQQNYFVVGDLAFGLKAAHRFKNGIGVGGQAGVAVLPGSQRLRAQAANFWLDALFSVDLRYLTARQFPFRFAANIGWMLDYSLTAADYGRVRDRVTREIARFSLEGNHSRVRMRYAIDFPLRVGKKDQVGIDPILEWSWDISHVNEQEAFAWPEIPPARPRVPRSSQWLTAGLRMNPVSGLFLDAAVDVGLLSPDHEWGPRVPVWQMLLGLGWAFDPAAPPKTIEVAAGPDRAATVLEGRIVGRVLDPQGAPVSDAVLRFPGLTSGAVVTTEGGDFISYRFPAGPVTVQVVMQGTVLAETTATVEDEKDTELTITLETMPVPATGIVRGQFTDVNGRPVLVRMQIVGQGVDEGFDSDPGGQIALELYAGDYRATLSADGYESKTIDFTVPAEGDLSVSERLNRAEAPLTPLVSGSLRGIRLRRAIQYRGNDVAPSSHELLDQLAMFLDYHQEYEFVRIAVHTDDSGDPSGRSNARAEAVRSYLVGKGVSPARLDAKGYGDSRPLAVNLTSAGRAKNNRTTLSVIRSNPELAPPVPAEPETSSDAPVDESPSPTDEDPSPEVSPPAADAQDSTESTSTDTGPASPPL